MNNDISTYIQRQQQRVNDCLHQRLQSVQSSHPPLGEAMVYSLMGQGKRLRPILAYAAAEAVGKINELVDSVACALECIHTYSLIHDDLPAMDDDDLRRGSPTCHKAFDEATAILAGDALQSLAFQCLATSSVRSPALGLSLIQDLAKAAGHQGMVGGQMLDLNAVGKSLDLPSLENLHANKTGALIKASVVMGAVASEAASDSDIQALSDYAQALGLAFQIHDDVLDVESSTETLGKPQGADARLNKPTYVSIVGLDQAKILAREQVEKSLAALTHFGQRGDTLKKLAHYMIERHA